MIAAANQQRSCVVTSQRSPSRRVNGCSSQAASQIARRALFDAAHLLTGRARHVDRSCLETDFQHVELDEATPARTARGQQAVELPRPILSQSTASAAS